MKCAMCGREIRGRDYIHVSTANKKEIYVHSVPCEWYASEEHIDNGA